MPFAKKLVENIRKRILLWNGTHGENVHAKLGFAGKAHSQEARRPAHKKDQATRSWGQLWGHLAGRDLQLFIHINNLQTLFGSALRRGLVPIGLKLGGVSSAFGSPSRWFQQIFWRLSQAMRLAMPFPAPATLRLLFCIALLV